MSGKTGKPSDHTPPGYEFRLNCFEDVNLAECKRQALRILRAPPETLTYVPGSYKLSRLGSLAMPWIFQPFGFMVFSRKEN